MRKFIETAAEVALIVALVVFSVSFYSFFVAGAVVMCRLAIFGW